LNLFLLDLLLLGLIIFINFLNILMARYFGMLNLHQITVIHQVHLVARHEVVEIFALQDLVNGEKAILLALLRSLLFSFLSELAKEAKL
jgi:hypothetical protein